MRGLLRLKWTELNENKLKFYFARFSNSRFRLDVGIVYQRSLKNLHSEKKWNTEIYAYHFAQENATLNNKSQLWCNYVWRLEEQKSLDRPQWAIVTNWWRRRPTVHIKIHPFHPQLILRVASAVLRSRLSNATFRRGFMVPMEVIEKLA